MSFEIRVNFLKIEGVRIINLEKIINSVTARIAPLSVDANRCCKINSPQSKCTICETNCPQGAIKINRKQKQILFDDNCLECGLCASNCPLGAIELQEPTEIGLLNKIKSIGEGGGTVVLSCHLNKEVSSKAIKVPCLGSLSLEFLLAVSLLEFPVYIIYREEKCNACTVRSGIKTYLGQLEKVMTLREALSVSENAIKHNHTSPKIVPPKKGDKENKVDLERRQFFGFMAAEVKNAPKTILDNLIGVSVKNNNRGLDSSQILTNRLRLLQLVLEKKMDKEVLEVSSSFHLSPILKDDCYFCKACIKLCPVGALQYIEGQGIFMDNGYCTGCGLCVDACYYKGLVLEPSSLVSIRNKDKAILAKEEKKHCKSCGKSIVVNEEAEICFSCKNK
ncbi:ATP-binding protein [Alkaliphilus sp. B6464]|uniref:ATP-binding protein n=1 Tax=Alkaliphilus sp. B6464 TaxID=2731219 RepID=UPI001BAA0BAB|nr:4Fe-4S dicluster domain-containing protein [Alkaliphilus sp. B6464]QUH19921.1 4Fe-4S dicluster domain-containing protein [Alkaliphilus sp. B6464]